MTVDSQTAFIAYARTDYRWQEKVSIHLRVLEASSDIDVWSDKRIGGGEDWLHEIENAIARAQVAILLISVYFLTSDFITRKEIPDILQRRTKDGLHIIPILIRDCAWKRVPWLKAINIRPRGGKSLAGRTLAGADKELAVITEEVAQILDQAAPKNKRSETPSIDKIAVKSDANPIKPLDTLPIGGLALPCFFPSVSGAAKSSLFPIDHLRVLVNMKHPCFLASVYDFARADRDDRLEMGSLIEQAANNGQIILLDSGTYERRWLRDNNWSRRSYHSALSSIRCHFGFFFDNVRVKSRSTPQETAIAVATQVRSDRHISDLEALFPIVHAKDPSELPELCKLVSSDLDTDVIAVTERELGDGLLAGAKTMMAIRHALDETNRYRIIHVLGAGNPMSMLVYASCGADSFDGLDWCQTVVDYEGKRLYHNLQLDFFKDQSKFAQATDLSYPTRMLAHNLQFYKGWAEELQIHKENGTMSTLLKKVLPGKFFDELLKLQTDGASENAP